MPNIIEITDFSAPELDIYARLTAKFDVLTQLTAFQLTRGMLCAIRRPKLPSVETVCSGTRRITVLELDGFTGKYSTPSGYFVDEGEAEKFDKQFSPKEKLKLQGQLW